MAISQNFPTTRPSLNLNFARSRKLDSRVTFTRGSTGTYVDDAGLIRTAGINEARFDYNPISGESLGLLVEESRSNLITYSEQFNDASWISGNISVTTNTTATTAPDGSTNAEKLVATSVNGEHFVYKTPAISTGTYTLSVFAKAAGYNFIGLRIDDIVAGVQRIALFDLSGGTVGVTSNITLSSIIPYPNGWYKCSITVTGQVQNYVFPFFPTNSNSGWTGDGTSGIYIWGAQLESGAFPTSYIPTVASTVTRSADNASITGTNFTDFYNSSEGSVISSFKFYANHPPYYEAVSVAGSGAGFMVIDAAGGLVTDCYGGGTVVTGGDNARTKFITGVRAYKFSTNDSVIGCSGASSITTQTGTITNPNTTALWLGRRGDGGSTYIMNGHIRNVSYYPVRLTNTQLQTLTK